MPEENNNEVLKKQIAFLKSLLLNVFEFCKKNWKIEVIVAFFIVVLILLFNLVPVISLNDIRLVNLGSVVRIKSGQTAKLKTGNVFVEIANYTSACPVGQNCFGNAKGVEYMLTVEAQKYATGSLNPDNASNYRIKTVSTDYETYAEIEITKLKE